VGLFPRLLSFVVAVVEPLLSTALQTKWPQPLPTPSLTVLALFLSVMMVIYVSLFLDRLFSHCSTIVFFSPFPNTLLLSCLCTYCSYFEDSLCFHSAG
jgi:hypothetical protein